MTALLLTDSSLIQRGCGQFVKGGPRRSPLIVYCDPFPFMTRNIYWTHISDVPSYPSLSHMLRCTLCRTVRRLVGDVPSSNGLVSGILLLSMLHVQLLRLASHFGYQKYVLILRYFYVLFQSSQFVRFGIFKFSKFQNIGKTICCLVFL